VSIVPPEELAPAHEESDRTAQLAQLLPRAFELVARWEASWGPVQGHPALAVDDRRLEQAWAAFAERVAGQYPFFHPRYAGQMLKPPHPVAAAGYLAAMLVNPNNHALDGGPATSEMERDVVGRLGGMFRLPAQALGHLTSSGTIANLEALWVARELDPERGVLLCEQAHYTHGRVCGLLRIPSATVRADPEGRIDLEAADRELATGRYGTLVLTAGTTGVGAVDRIDEALALRERHGVRLHVDAAYGGFFALLAGAAEPLVPIAPLRAIGQCDSVVVDPHKHGLQPYGCGAVLFADPRVGRLYKHDSPYTYFTSDDLHLGEISLECSRAGAAAAALWLTLEALPLEPESGVGAVLTACVRGARELAARLDGSDLLELHLPPELDIVTYFPRPASATLSEIDAASMAMLELGIADPDPVFLSLLRLQSGALRARHRRLRDDAATAAVVRSVLMKPEHEPAVPWLAARLETLAAAALKARVRR
jgi:glutamate/tyrosine decarboxylase-like PLP-dependent enzyme